MRVKCGRVSRRLSCCYATNIYWGPWQGSWLPSPLISILSFFSSHRISNIYLENVVYIFQIPLQLGVCTWLSSGQWNVRDFWVVSFKGRICLFLSPSYLLLLGMYRNSTSDHEDEDLTQRIAEWKDGSRWVPHFHTIFEPPTSGLQWEG